MNFYADNIFIFSYLIGPWIISNLIHKGNTSPAIHCSAQCHFKNYLPGKLFSYLGELFRCEECQTHTAGGPTTTGYLTNCGPVTPAIQQHRSASTLSQVILPDCWPVIKDNLWHLQYIPRNMHTFFALLCFVAVIHWLIFPYPSGLLHWHCGNLTIAPVPAKQPWWIWINTSCEFIMNDCVTTTKQSTTKPCAYFLGYTVPESNFKCSAGIILGMG